MADDDQIAEIVARARDGQPRAVARLISWVEDDSPLRAKAMSALASAPGRAQVIGVTGPPGVGKSTMTSALVGAWRARGQRVGVIAVDPTSPFSGGALLGDRIRMHDHATDPGVFIRSMASRGHLGGLAATTPQVVRILEAAGCQIVIIETVGVGQSEVEVAAAADTTVVLLAPGMGDGIQAAKAGILEIGDVICVNKADRDGAQTTARELRQMLALADRGPQGWQPRVVTAVASRAEIEDVLDAIDAHREWLGATGAGDMRRRRRAAEEIVAIAVARIRLRLDAISTDVLDALADAVAEGRMDPFEAAAAALEHLDSSDYGPVPG